MMCFRDSDPYMKYIFHDLSGACLLFAGNVACGTMIVTQVKKMRM